MKVNLIIILIACSLSACFEIENNVVFTGKTTEIVSGSGINQAKLANNKYIIGGIFSSDIQKSGLISKYDASTGNKITDFKPDNYFREDFWHFRSMDVSSNGKYVAGSGLYTNMGSISYLIVWDIETGKEVFSINPGKYYQSIRFTPDGKKLYLYKQQGRFDIIEFLNDKMNYYKTDSLQYTNSFYDKGQSFYFTKDGRYIYFDTPDFIDLAKKPYILQSFIGNYGAIYPDKDRMLVFWQNEIYVYNPKTSEKISSFIDEYVDKNELITISPGGKYFASYYTFTKEGNDILNGIQIFSAGNGKLITRINDIYNAYQLEFLDDNRLLAVYNGNFKIFNISE